MCIVVSDTWPLFCITFGTVLLTNFIMRLHGMQFFTHDGSTRQFSILDLQFAANGKEINNILRGIFLLPAKQTTIVVKALKVQLYVDFLFMPAAYGSVFLLCMETASKLTTDTGRNIFAIMAWLQLLPWICDVAENIFLLRRISSDPADIPGKTFRAYQINEWLKWGISLTGMVCSMASMLYFWLSGNYTSDSLVYLLIVIAELVLFILLAKRFIVKPKADPVTQSSSNKTI